MSPLPGLNIPQAVPRGEEPAAEISLHRRFFNVQTLISFGVAFAIIYLLLTRLEVDYQAILGNLRQSNPFWLLAALLLYYLSFPLRGIRWRMLLENVGFRERLGVHLPSWVGMGELILLGWFANCIVPAKLGDAYRAYLIKKNAKVSFSRTMGTVVAERAIDMIVLCGLLAGAALGLVGGATMGTALGILGIGFGFVLLVVLGLLALYRLGGWIQRFLPRRLQPKFQSLQEGTLHSFQQLPLLLLLTLLVWAAETGRLYLVSQSLAVTLSVPLVLFVALAGSLLTTIPFTPGGLGLVEIGIAGLLMLTVSKEDAISITVLDRVISYWSLIFFGLLVFFFSRKR